MLVVDGELLPPVHCCLLFIVVCMPTREEENDVRDAFVDSDTRANHARNVSFVQYQINGMHAQPMQLQQRGREREVIINHVLSVRAAAAFSRESAEKLSNLCMTN